MNTITQQRINTYAAKAQPASNTHGRTAYIFADAIDLQRLCFIQVKAKGAASASGAAL